MPEPESKDTVTFSVRLTEEQRKLITKAAEMKGWTPCAHRQHFDAYTFEFQGRGGRCREPNFCSATSLSNHLRIFRVELSPTCCRILLIPQLVCYVSVSAADVSLPRTHSTGSGPYGQSPHTSAPAIAFGCVTFARFIVVPLNGLAQSLGHANARLGVL